ncbi:glyoxalase/bleomycin resistance protein/dioxygenase [Natrinema thermotolerans DSM 11552]|nr:glyoxalase/bleomycin resistance protein/dioxygenase [Natrinema thermotolerans DSM 11552]
MTASSDPSPTLPDGTRLGRAALVVADRTATVDFYRDTVGLRVVERADRTTTLGTEGTALLVVREDSTVASRDERAAGLYHTAFRVPSRAALAAALERLRDGWTLEGASDHGISEALYCTDPAGNGVEIYRDRPRAAWPRADDGTIRADGAPLDLDALAAAGDAGPAPTGPQLVPDGTTIGHVHLEVSSLEAARSFYADRLGFDVTMTGVPGALFFAAGDYHHHVGTNTWNRRSEPAGGRGLAWFELLVPGEGALEAVRERLLEADVSITDRGDGFEVIDPDGTAVRLRPGTDSSH